MERDSSSGHAWNYFHQNVRIAPRKLISKEVTSTKTEAIGCNVGNLLDNTGQIEEDAFRDWRHCEDCLKQMPLTTPDIGD
jgi:hypothetical protein